MTLSHGQGSTWDTYDYNPPRPPEPWRRLEQISERLERDRREPDKVLCYVRDLERLSREMREAQ